VRVQHTISTICIHSMFSITWYKWSYKILRYEHVSLFWNVDSKYRSVYWFNTNAQPEMLTTNLNYSFINYECSNSSVFVIDVRWTKGWIHPKQKQDFFFVPLNYSNALDVFRRLTKKVQIQIVHNNNSGCSVSDKS